MKALAERIRREAEVAARPGQLDRLIALADEAERLQIAAHTLGRLLTYWMDLAKESTDSFDLIGDDGDGDWGAVADRLSAMSPLAQKVEALADEWDSDAHSDLTQRACAALLRARILGADNA